jgi:hypothetical protein
MRSRHGRSCADAFPELYKPLPDSALAIIPNASHLLLHQHPDELSGLVGDFLTDRLVPPLMPLRRAAPRSHPLSTEP